jgi:ATP-binding protein involved in chromosome partitioning
MFQQVNVPILGVVENMAGYVIEGRVEGAGAGTSVSLRMGADEETVETDAEGRFRAVAHVFGMGGADRLSARHGFPVLGRIPLNPAVRVGGDAGDPVVISHPDSIEAETFRKIAGAFAQRVAIREHAELPILQ